MFDGSTRHRDDGSRSTRVRASRPILEPLEGRILLYATTGDRFASGGHVTLSIMPDGTSLGGVPSNLQATLNKEVGVGVWEAAFQQAAAWWEDSANINVVWVGDDGVALGTGAYQQGDPNMGDIRIGGFAQNGNTLAFSLLPPPANGDSSSGDITFNTAVPWTTTGGNGGFDLETIAIHEIGHALGLGHSADPNASMYYAYNGAKTSPDGDDAAGIQSIWGPRPEDGLAQGWANYAGPSHAANITPFLTGNGQITLPSQDIANVGESYWFKVTTPANASRNLSVAVQSANLSSLSPAVQLYDANLNGLIQTSAGANAYGSCVGVTYSSATPNTTYYIRVMGGGGTANGAGAYALMVNTGNASMSMVSPTINQVAAQGSNGGGGLAEVQIGGANDAANTAVDVPDLIIYPTMEAEGDFLTRDGQDPAVYRVARNLTAATVAGHAGPAPSTTTAPSAPIPNPAGAAGSAASGAAATRISVPKPSGPIAVPRRPAQDRSESAKLGK